MFQFYRVLKPEFRRPPSEFSQGYAIAEGIMDPPHAGRSRTDVQGGIEKPLVVAIAGPEHHPVLAQRHRPPVPICCRMTDGKVVMALFRSLSTRGRGTSSKALRSGFA